jgi:uncharacterized LabA/DUF88 family protein
MSKHRANFYIDGFNFYHGICATKRKDLLWLDLIDLTSNLIRKQEILNRVKYFTTLPKGPKSKIDRHKTWLKLLQNLSHPIEIYTGRFNKETTICRNCGKEMSKWREKRTDVNIAVNLICDAFSNEFEVAYIISGDSDFVPAIQAIKNNFPEKKIKIFFPPRRAYAELVRIADFSKQIAISRLTKYVLPDEVILKDGTRLIKPVNWTKNRNVTL